MRRKNKPWVIVHFKVKPNQPVKDGYGLASWGFAIFSIENWDRYWDSLPEDGFLVKLCERCGTMPRGFKDKADYHRNLHLKYLSDFDFKRLCKNVLNVSPGVLILRLGQMREDDCRPVAKYGIFPEYECKSLKEEVLPG